MLPGLKKSLDVLKSSQMSKGRRHMHQNGFGQLEENTSSVKPTDNIEQVRELLFGEHQRRLHAQVNELDQRITRLEEKVLQVRQEILEKLESSEIAQNASQRDFVNNIADSIKKLGDQIHSSYKKQKCEPSYESAE